MSNLSIQLSICIPAYNRPAGLKKAIESIITQQEFELKELEVIISDDSTEIECQIISHKMLKEWKGTWRYVKNIPRLGMAANWNHSIQLAQGKYVLVLHDDDYLLSGSILSILQTIKEIKSNKEVLLFGVYVVDSMQQVVKKQVFNARHYLIPRVAVREVLSNSSLVRFPGIVINRAAFIENGYFNEEVGGVADLEMWVRLFKEYGVWCCTPRVAAYMVHMDSLTMEMFNEHIISQLIKLFNGVEESHLLRKQELEKCKTNFFHQFILAGTFRYLRRNKIKKAATTIKLFQIPEISNLKAPPKWFFLRKAFEIINILYP